MPGISRVVYNLPVALGYGLMSLHLHKKEIDGSEVMAWAKWLVLRMSNRVAAALATGKDSRAEHLAMKIVEKLTTEGPMKVRDLSRRINRLKAVDCRKALNLLAEQGIAGQQDGVWGILGKQGTAFEPVVRERKAS